MAISSHSLPPRAIFTHNETLHAILLPPLALFLGGLSAPDQLLKLNDILDRFRTPKSYHRVDVRLVESSELPPPSEDGKADVENDDGEGPGVVQSEGAVESGRQKIHHGSGSEEQRLRWKEERGEPIILEEGMTMEEYLVQNPPRQAPSGNNGRNKLDDGYQNNSGGTTTLLKGMPKGPNSQAGPSHVNGDYASTSTPTSPNTDPPPHHVETINDHIDVDPYHPEDSSRTHSSINPPLPANGPPSPIPSHTLPPSGPKRRIRELRLDLRTLDAAALFALETWRRDMLGLKKLDLDHPDSIWYKGPAPASPSPSPSPEEIPPPSKKRGRLTKNESRVADGDIIVVDEEEGGEGYETLMEALSTHGMVVDKAENQGQADLPVQNDTILEELQEAAGPGGPHDILMQESEPLFMESEGEEELEEEIDMLEDSDREPSPDVILDDMFDRRDEEDPDFEPPPDPPVRDDESSRIKDNGPTDKGKGIAHDPHLLTSPVRAHIPEIIDLTSDTPPRAGPSRLSVNMLTVTSSSKAHINRTKFVDITPTQHAPGNQASSSSLDPPRFFARRSGEPLGKQVAKRTGGAPQKAKWTLDAVVIETKRKRLNPRKSVHFVEPTRSALVDVDNQLLLPPFQRGGSRKVMKSLNERSLAKMLAKRNVEDVRKRKEEERSVDSDDEPLRSPSKKASGKSRQLEVVKVDSDDEEGNQGEELSVAAAAPAPEEADEEWGFLRGM